MNIQRILKTMGFEKCEEGPRSDDICESCGKPNLQLYCSGGTAPGEDYSYWCLDCVVAMREENEATIKRIEELEAQGHHPHCAARQVWGDGECECGLYKKGYDPYGWVRRAYRKGLKKHLSLSQYLRGELSDGRWHMIAEYFTHE